MYVFLILAVIGIVYIFFEAIDNPSELRRGLIVLAAMLQLIPWGIVGVTLIQREQKFNLYNAGYKAGVEQTVSVKLDSLKAKIDSAIFSSYKIKK